MSMLKVACEDQRLYLVESTTIASGGVNETRVLFNFCSRWDGFVKTAVFYRNMSKPYYAVVNDENIALIPWEVLKDPGLMYFGVFGIKGGVNRTSEVLTIRIVPGAITAEIAPADPTPDIYIQILSDYSTILERMSVVDQSIADVKLSADNVKQSENNVTEAETHVGEMENNVETLVNRFDTHVGEKKTEVSELTEECKTEIGNYKNGCKTEIDTLADTRKNEIDNFTEECKTELDDYINESGVATITDVRKAAPRNLLDNSDFRNPVNQKGLESYSGTVYGIDKWYGRGITLTVSVRDTDVRVIATGTGYVGLKQKVVDIAKYAGKTVTLALNVDSAQTVTVGFVNSADTVIKETIDNSAGSRVIICSCTVPADATPDKFIPRLLMRTSAANDYMTLYWAALYEGEYTAETLPEYHPKGYGAELAECQRYYQIRSENNIPAVDMRPLMRLENPTITKVTNGYAYSAEL